MCRNPVGKHQHQPVFALRILRHIPFRPEKCQPVPIIPIRIQLHDVQLFFVTAMKAEEDINVNFRIIKPRPMLHDRMRNVLGLQNLMKDYRRVHRCLSAFAPHGSGAVDQQQHRHIRHILSLHIAIPVAFLYISESFGIDSAAVPELFFPFIDLRLHNLLKAAVIGPDIDPVAIINILIGHSQIEVDLRSVLIYFDIPVNDRGIVIVSMEGCKASLIRKNPYDRLFVFCIRRQ